jgi:radical SAM protein with 4Fe4S-binding SPASM domain
MRLHIADNLNLLSKLTGRRLYNMGRLLLSFLLSRSKRKPFHFGMPVVLEVEPTTSCNLRCPQCVSGLRKFSRNTGMLDLPLFEKIIDELHHDLIWLVLYFQGEPFLNKSFLSFVKYAAAKNIYTATSSNAHYFTDETARATIESGLDRLIISIDGVTQASYSQYRIGGDLEKVLEGTRNILKWKKQLKSTTPHVIWQFIVFKHNEGELDTVRKMAKEIGVDELDIKTAQVYGYETDKHFIPADETLSRYQKRDDGRYQVKGHQLNECWRMWRSSVITWDGLVVPCCFDKDATYRFGDITKQTFSAVWKGQLYNDFRGALLTDRNSIDICKNCTEGIKIYSSKE